MISVNLFCTFSNTARLFQNMLRLKLCAIVLYRLTCPWGKKHGFAPARCLSYYRQNLHLNSQWPPFNFYLFLITNGFQESVICQLSWVWCPVIGVSQPASDTNKYSFSWYGLKFLSLYIRIYWLYENIFSMNGLAH